MYHSQSLEVYHYFFNQSNKQVLQL